MNKKKSNTLQVVGLTQLSLVEHALCPLDTRGASSGTSLHETSYRYTDSRGERHTATARISSTYGLSPTDEFYLWGMLALCFAQDQPTPDFYATPHYCLRELGVIEGQSKGGKSYRLFRESLRRLSGVRYENDRFYDPVRKEHRRVAFGLLGYSLPIDPNSSRAWRIVWDTQFFEFCRATGGRLRFDLGLFRQLDPASRRLMLLLQKVFYRRRESPRFDVRHLAVDVLGFAGSLPASKLRKKVERASGVLREAGVISGSSQFTRCGSRVRFTRGARLASPPPRLRVTSSPLLDSLLRIGFKEPDAGRLLRRYQPEQVRIWSDVTLAAIESRGMGFFHRSPVAYLVDNLKRASRGNQTPPDWFLALQKQDGMSPLEKARKDNAEPREPTRAMPQRLSEDDLVMELARQFRAAGQDQVTADRNAKLAGRFAKVGKS